MNIDQLEYFMVLAQELNYTRAANDLFITQSVLSRSITRLEDELGAKLFFRDTRNVRLTQAGITFYHRCPEILDNYRSAITAARMAAEGKSGIITLGILRDSFEPALPGIIKAFYKNHPDIIIYIKSYSHSALLRAYENDEVDAVVNYIPDPDLDREKNSLILRRNQQCVICGKDHPLANRDGVRMEELKHEKFVVMARSVSVPGYDFILRTANDAGFTPEIVAEATHLPILLSLVACHPWVSTLSEDMEYLSFHQVAFVPLIGVALTNLAFRWKDENDNPALPHLIATIEQLISTGSIVQAK